MIIQRLFSEKEKPGKKEKIAKGISIASGIGALGSAGKAIYHDTISKNATIDEQKRAEKLAKKTGTKVAGYFNDKLEGDPEKIKKAESLGVAIISEKEFMSVSDCESFRIILVFITSGSDHACT